MGWGVGVGMLVGGTAVSVGLTVGKGAGVVGAGWVVGVVGGTAVAALVASTIGEGVPFAAGEQAELTTSTPKITKLICRNLSDDNCIKCQSMGLPSFFVLGLSHCRIWQAG
jgi:hypothetical protein